MASEPCLFTLCSMSLRRRPESIAQAGVCRNVHYRRSKRTASPARCEYLPVRSVAPSLARRARRSRHPLPSSEHSEPTDSMQATPMFHEAAVGIAVADRHLPWKAGAERPMDGLEACRRSATALMLRFAAGRLAQLSALALIAETTARRPLPRDGLRWLSSCSSSK